MAEISTEVLISLIQEKECLWDVSSNTYKNKNLKMEAWKYICEQIFDEAFEDLSDDEKKKRSKYNFLFNFLT